MVEPTETEAKENLDRLAAAFRHVAALARTDPGRLTTAPHTAPVARLDEARATRRPDLRYRPGESLPETDPERLPSGVASTASRP